MRSKFKHDFRHEVTIIKFTGNVYCPNKMNPKEFCVHRNTFQPLSKSDYECIQCASISQIRHTPFGKETNSSFLMSNQEVYNFEETQKGIQDVTGECILPEM